MRMVVIFVLFGYVVTSYAVAQDALEKVHWTDRIVLEGDLRFRHERTDEEGKDIRTRQRLRARIGAYATVSDELDVGIRAASGSDDPRSTNQTLGDSFGSKNLNLDLAYFAWHPEVLRRVNIIGGKMKNPHIAVSDLIWDTDVNPEGLAVKFAKQGENIDIVAVSGGDWLEERSADDDTLLYSAQLAGKIRGQDGIYLLAGGSFFYYENMMDFPVLFDDMNSLGNTSTPVVDPDTGETVELLYDTEFRLVEAFAELGLNVKGVPITVYGDYVVNTEVGDDDTGYMIGAKLGKAKKAGSAQIDYNYRRLEADAVVGALADADFCGGGTDGKGHKVSVAYQIFKNWQIAASLFLNEKHLHGESTDYDKVQLDLKAKF